MEPSISITNTAESGELAASRLLPERPRWMARAACLHADPELFFPERRDRHAPRAAKAVCGGCPVLRECRDYALADETLVGIWGGTTERERRALRREAA